jgi:hypothetical protein
VVVVPARSLVAYQEEEIVAQTIVYHDGKGRLIPIDADNPLAVELQGLGSGILIIPDELNINGTFAVAGNNTVVAAPGAGQRIVVSAFVIQNESGTATTMILASSGSLNDGWRLLGQNQGDGLAMAFSAGREWRLGTNEALILNLSGANSCGYSVQYYTETVG